MHTELTNQHTIPQCAKRKPSGFTITEVVMASALLIVAIVPILKALTSTQVSSATIERRSRSLILAQAKLDDIRARSIYDYTNGGLSFSQSNIPLDGSYLCNVTDNAGDPLKTISVSVGYDLNGNNVLAPGEVEVILSTLIARRQP